MNILKEYAIKYETIIAKITITFAFVSSFFITGLFGLGKYGSFFNYTLCALFFIYVSVVVIAGSWKNILKERDSAFVLLFLILYVISILLNSNKVQNSKIFILTGVQLIVMFMAYKNYKSFVIKGINIMNFIFFLTTVIGLIMFIINFWVSNFMERFCGLYENPNTGGAIAFISIGLSLYLLAKSPVYKRIYLFMNMFLQICMMKLCLSRGSDIALLILVIVFIAMYSTLKHRRVIFVIRNLIIALACIYFSYNIFAPKIYNLQQYVMQSKEEENDLKLENDKENVKDNNDVWVSVRDEEKKNVSDDYRLRLLKAGAMATMHNPLFGVGTTDLPKTVNSYSDIKLDGIEMGGVHNAYLQMIVANGYIGFIAFSCIIISVLLRLFKNRQHIMEMSDIDDKIRFSAIFALFICFLAYGMLESVIVLNSSIITYVFMMTLGGLRDVY